MRTKMRTPLSLEHAHQPGAAGSAVRTPESPSGQRTCDPQAALRSYVEQGLSAAPERAGLTRSAATLPRLDGPLKIEDHQLSNTALFELLDP